MADIKQDRIQQASVQSLLVQILETSTFPKSMNQLQVATMLAEVIAATSLYHKAFHSNMLMALSNPGIQDHIKTLLETDRDGVEEHWDLPCPNSNTSIRQTCLSATISMLLTILLTSSSGPIPTIPTSLGVALVEKQRQLCTPVYECTHAGMPHILGRRSKYAALPQQI